MMIVVILGGALLALGAAIVWVALRPPAQRLVDRRRFAWILLALGVLELAIAASFASDGELDDGTRLAAFQGVLFLVQAALISWDRGRGDGASA